MPKKPQRKPIGKGLRSAPRQPQESAKSIGGALIQFPWRREWGRPPVWMIFGALLFDLVLFGCWLALGIGGAAQVSQSPPGDWGNTALLLVAVGIWLAAGGWLLRSMLRAWKYRQSFSWSADRQAELDSTIDEEDIVTSHNEIDRQRALIEGCVASLRAAHSVKLLGDVERQRVERRLQRFAPRGNPHDLKLSEAYRVATERGSCVWLVFQYDYHYPTARSSGSGASLRQATLVELPFDPGWVFIRPEGLADKFAELWGSQDVDFQQHAQFSRRYFVAATDPQRVQEKLSRSFMDAFCDESQFVARIQDGWLLVSRDHKLEAGESLPLVATALAAGRKDQDA